MLYNAGAIISFAENQYVGLLWETQHSGTHYCVRSAGRSIRLYSNGVFHSQWNPARPFAGAIWDCLSLPVLYRDPAEKLRILLLGLGGGAGVRQLQSLTNFSALDAIEIDPVHIHIAQRWFGVDDTAVNVHLADAVTWLMDYDGEPYDLIIDDLFGHTEGEPVRAQSLTPNWVAELRTRLAPDGMLVVNCIDQKDLHAAAPYFIKQGFVQGYKWSQHEYYNTIGVLFQQPVMPSAWSKHLEQSGLDAAMQRQARKIIRRPFRMTSINY